MPDGKMSTFDKFYSQDYFTNAPSIVLFFKLNYLNMLSGQALLVFYKQFGCWNVVMVRRIAESTSDRRGSGFEGHNFQTFFI